MSSLSVQQITPVARPASSGSNSNVPAPAASVAVQMPMIPNEAPSLQDRVQKESSEESQKVKDEAASKKNIDSWNRVRLREALEFANFLESYESNLKDQAPAVQKSTVPSQASSRPNSVEEQFRQESERFRTTESGEIQSFLDWMSTQSEVYNLVTIGKATSVDPISIKDITIYDPKKPIENPAIEEEYTLVPEDDLLADQYVTSHDLESQQSQGVIAKAINTFWKALGYK